MTIRVEVERDRRRVGRLVLLDEAQWPAWLSGTERREVMRINVAELARQETWKALDERLAAAEARVRELESHWEYYHEHNGLTRLLPCPKCLATTGMGLSSVGRKTAIVCICGHNGTPSEVPLSFLADFQAICCWNSESMSEIIRQSVAAEARVRELEAALECIHAKADEVVSSCAGHEENLGACAVLLSIAVGIIDATARKALKGGKR